MHIMLTCVVHFIVVLNFFFIIMLIVALWKYERISLNCIRVSTQVYIIPIILNIVPIVKLNDFDSRTKLQYYANAFFFLVINLGVLQIGIKA